MSVERPLYFPVRPEPLRMQAGLFRLGTDFGNGEADRLFFPNDALRPHYLAEKARVLASYPGVNASVVRGELDAAAVAEAEAWFGRTLTREGHAAGERRLSELGRELMEDFALLRRDPSGADRALFVHVCFPSGWRPEHVVGKSFAQIHARIPAFGAVAKKARPLVEAMLTRGPYVRFVWTVSADSELDHHPDHGRRSAWSPSTERAFLRVERQTIVPLPRVQASLFLIRTFLYGFEELSGEQRATLARALELMPREIARYKGLEGAVSRALQLLAPRT